MKKIMKKKLQEKKKEIHASKSLSPTGDKFLSPPTVTTEHTIYSYSRNQKTKTKSKTKSKANRFRSLSSREASKETESHRSSLPPSLSLRRSSADREPSCSFSPRPPRAPGRAEQSHVPALAASSGGGNAAGGGGGGALVNLGFSRGLVCVLCGGEGGRGGEKEGGDEGDRGEPRDGERDGVEGGAMRVRRCLYRLHGLCSRVLGLHCFLVLVQSSRLYRFLSRVCFLVFIFLLSRYRIFFSGFSVL